MIALPTRARILVVTLRHLGDVLLTMPPMRSLKQAFPGCCLEALAWVFL